MIALSGWLYFKLFLVFSMYLIAICISRNATLQALSITLDSFYMHLQYWALSVLLETVASLYWTKIIFGLQQPLFHGIIIKSFGVPGVFEVQTHMTTPPFFSRCLKKYQPCLLLVVRGPDFTK